jgi:hypothetical protein
LLFAEFSVDKEQDFFKFDFVDLFIGVAVDFDFMFVTCAVDLVVDVVVDLLLITDDGLLRVGRGLLRFVVVEIVRADLLGTILLLLLVVVRCVIILFLVTVVVVLLVRGVRVFFDDLSTSSMTFEDVIKRPESFAQVK